ncbi:hypothetical protein ACROYT_G035494 [Oculina patagonica]
MALTTEFPVSAAKFTSARLDDLCKTESKNTTGTSDSLVSRPPLFQSTPTTPDTTRFGMRDNGIEIPEAWMPTIKKHNNRRTVRQRTAEGTTGHRNARIEMHESQLLKTNQSQRSSVLYKFTHNQSTLSPDED